MRTIPKVELHLHIEGTLEPELMFRLARRNGVRLPYADVRAVRKASTFRNLQSFLDLYYQSAHVLVHAQDFSELTAAYLRRASDENVRHVEIFFDPQTHTNRGIEFDTVIDGIHRALLEGSSKLGISSKLIMCFLRDESAESAMRTLDQGIGFRDLD